MAGWITAFKAIPWTQVLAAAPAVVVGARKLWDAVRKQEAPKVAGQAPTADRRALEEQVAELRAELAGASEIVTRLAEQNNRLVEAVEVLRARTRLLFAVCAILAVGLVAVALAG